MIEQVDHITIAVADCASATELYRRLLGSEPRWRGAHPDLGTEASIFGVGNACIELIGPREGAPEAEGLRAHLEASGEGMQALALSVGDADAARVAFRERGLRAAPPVEGVAGGAGEERRYRVVELSPRSTRGLSIFAVERPAEDLARLTEAPAGPAAVSALDHAVILTSDVEAALALYGEGLGLRLALDVEVAGRRMLFFRTGHATVEVVEDASALESDRFYGLCYRVMDLELARARLDSEGFQPGPVYDGKKPGTRAFQLPEAVAGVPTLLLYDPSRT